MGQNQQGLFDVSLYQPFCKSAKKFITLQQLSTPEFIELMKLMKEMKEFDFCKKTDQIEKWLNVCLLGEDETITFKSNLEWNQFWETIAHPATSISLEETNLFFKACSQFVEETKRLVWNLELEERQIPHFRYVGPGIFVGYIFAGLVISKYFLTFIIWENFIWSENKLQTLYYLGKFLIGFMFYIWLGISAFTNLSSDERIRKMLYDLAQLGVYIIYTIPPLCTLPELILNFPIPTVLFVLMVAFLIYRAIISNRGKRNFIRFQRKSFSP